MSLITRRVTVPMMEELIGKEIPVPENGKGFVRLIDYMGDDSSIVQAARVSYGGGIKSPSEDAGLIDFLMRHKHTSPFEMCELKLHIKLPIFVMRQLVRHRTANLNELSARYTVVKDEFFLLTSEEIRAESATNKQCSEKSSRPESELSELCNLANKGVEQSYKLYQRLLDEGVAREIARTVLPLSSYTELYWKCDLHNLLHMLLLRSSSHAQKEIADFANAIINNYIKVWVPATYQSFLNHRVNGLTLSSNQKAHIFGLLSEEKVHDFIAKNSQEKGELRELVSILKSAMLKG